jgi:hypothetical protein
MVNVVEMDGQVKHNVVVDQYVLMAMIIIHSVYQDLEDPLRVVLPPEQHHHHHLVMMVVKMVSQLVIGIVVKQAAVGQAKHLCQIQ